MNWDQVEGKWEQMKGAVKQKWGKLTDDDLTKIQGKSEQLSGKLQERYGYNKEQAEKEMSSFVSSCGCDSKKACGTAEDGRVAYLFLYLMGAPIGLLALFWVVFGSNLVGAG